MTALVKKNLGEMAAPRGTTRKRLLEEIGLVGLAVGRCMALIELALPYRGSMAAKNAVLRSRPILERTPRATEPPADDTHDDLSKMDLPRRVVRNTLVQIVGRGMTSIVGLASLMILTRYLGVDGIGDYLLILSFLAFLDISNLGLFTITIRELSSGKGRGEAFLGNVVLIQIVLAVLAMALLSVVALLLRYPAELTIAMSLASLSFLYSALGRGSVGATFAAHLRMEFLVLSNIVRGVVFLGLLGLVVSQRLGLIELVLAYNASMLAKSAVVLHFSRKFIVPSFRFDLTLCRRLLVMALPFAVANVSWMAYNRIDMVMLSRMEGAEALGLYGLAYRFVELAWPFSFLFVVSVFPLLSRYYSSGEIDRLRRLFQKSLDVLSVFVIAGATTLIVFAEPIISFIASDEFLPAATSLQILSLAIVLIFVANLTYHTLFAVGKQATVAWASLLGLVSNVGLNLFMIPRFGFDGAAVATVVTELVVLLPLLIVLARQLDYFPSFGVGAKMVPVALVAGAAAVFLAPNGIFLQGVAMVFIFGIGIWLTRVVSIDDLRALWSTRSAGEAITPASHQPSAISGANLGTVAVVRGGASFGQNGISSRGWR